MFLSLILASLPAHADSEFAMQDMCAPYFQVGLPFGLSDEAVPPDGVIPVMVYASCGASGDAELRLHRGVDGIPAEELSSEEVTVEAEGWALVLLAGDEDLLSNTDYIVVLSSDLGEEQRGFSTGNTGAQGMADGAPTFAIDEFSAGELDEGDFNLGLDLSINALADPDALSRLEFFDSEDPTTPLAVYLPGTNRMISDSLYYTSSDNGEACYFVVQTDGIGNMSASDEVCLTPEVVDNGWSCSSAGAAPMLASSMVAMLMGLRRRRE
jgi:hypothetical protein